MRTQRLFALAGLFLLGLAPVFAQTAEVIIVKDIDARGDTPAYYSLRTNSLVDVAQKDTDAWDVSFSGTNIRLNPKGQGAFLQDAFDDVAEVPAQGLKKDETGSTVIPGGSDQGWYNYDFMTHSITPVPERTLIVQTPEGAFAKLEILSYYQGELDDPNTIGEPRFYSFRYILLPEGTTAF
ncbi:MAG: hypothetical protein RhofKO_02970 [Rhodothermales bacterium]